MRNCFKLFCVYLFLSIINVSSLHTQTVETQYGEVTGRSLKSSEGTTYVAFYGLPYGEPPLAEKRFMPPVPWRDVWSVPRDARRPGGGCPQLNVEDVTSSDFGQFEDFLTTTIPDQTMDEDCLTVDIIVPLPVTYNQDMSVDLKDLPRKPILVWFSNDNSISTSDGSDLSVNGDIIVVKVNHRTGVLGFLTMAVEGSEALDNVGLMDQQLALDWIQTNIWVFGGDEQRVTIIGEIVSLHLFIESSQPHFHRSIIPNNIIVPWDLPVSSIREGRRLADRTGCNSSQDTSANEILRCLRALSVTELLETSSALQSELGISWGPVRDATLFKTAGDESSEYVTGSHDILLGVESPWSDVRMVAPWAGREELSENSVSEMAFNSIVADISSSFNPVVEQSEIISSAVRQMYTEWRNPTDPILRAHSALNLLYDWYILYPAYDFLTVWVKGSNLSNVFLFVYDSEEEEDPTASVTDLILNDEEWTGNNYNATGYLTTFWSQFVQSGNPSKQGSIDSPVWSNFNFQSGEKYLRISRNATATEMGRYRAKQVKFWFDYLPGLINLTSANVSEESDPILWGLTPREVSQIVRVLLSLVCLMVLVCIIAITVCCGTMHTLKRARITTQQWMFKAQVYENSHQAKMQRDFRRELKFSANHTNFFQMVETSDEEEKGCTISYDSEELPDYMHDVTDESTFL